MDSHVELGWEPLDLTDEELQISDLLKDCSWVDHSVPAVTHMRGIPGVHCNKGPCALGYCEASSADLRCSLSGAGYKGIEAVMLL